MSQPAQWFERKFDFSFPVEEYPNVCKRLRGTPAKLEAVLRDISRDRLILKPDGKWSAQEHAGHLLDLEPLWTARVNDFLTGEAALTVADLSNRKTSEANHNARELAEILAEFRKVRFGWLEETEKLQPAVPSRCLLHPRLKQPMRLVDHLYFVAEHDDHHLARIEELVRP
jgi:uncharacterized damage-inducible protein DinB